MFCSSCGKEISDKAVICPGCGVAIKRAGEKSFVVTFVLAFFLGLFGIHRFYVGKTGSGICMLILTCTIFGMLISSLWVIVDWITIATGSFKDGKGNDLAR